jgi:exonuclease III
MLIKFTHPITSYIINAHNQTNNHKNFTNIKNISPLILGEDLNSYLNSTLDTFSSKCNPNKKPHPLIDLNKNGYADIYKIWYPESRTFTCQGHTTDKSSKITHISASRIDYFLGSEDILGLVSNIAIEDGFKSDSDHCMMVMEVFSATIPFSPSLTPSFYRKNIKNKDK